MLNGNMGADNARNQSMIFRSVSHNGPSQLPTRAIGDAEHAVERVTVDILVICPSNLVQHQAYDVYNQTKSGPVKNRNSRFLT